MKTRLIRLWTQEPHLLQYGGWLLDWYVPVMGLEAYGLYLALASLSTEHRLPPFPSGHDAEGRAAGTQTVYTEQELFALLGISQEKWYDARRKLEGIGLLSTRRTIAEDVDYYDLVLHAPLAPARFLESDVLTALLLGRLGLKGYESLLRRYGLMTHSPGSSDKEDHSKHEPMPEDISARFHEAYDGYVLSELVLKPGSDGARLTAVARTHVSQPLLEEDVIAWEIIDRPFQRFPQRPSHHPFLVQQALRAKKRYQLQDETLAYLIRDTFDGKSGFFDQERFRELLNVYKTLKDSEKDMSGGTDKRSSSTERSPTFTPDVSKPPDVSAAVTPNVSTGDKQTLIEAHLARLKRLSPIALLENYQGGAPVSAADRRLIQYLLKDVGLSEEVTNVLIDYVLLVQDNTLPRAFVEKVATSWKRQGFQKAEEAFYFARAMYLKQRKLKETSHALPNTSPDRMQEHKDVDRSVLRNTKREKKTPSSPRHERFVPEYIWAQVDQDQSRDKEALFLNRAQPRRDIEQDLKKIEQMIRDLEGGPAEHVDPA